MPEISDSSIEVHWVGITNCSCSVKTAKASDTLPLSCHENQMSLLYDKRFSGIEDKFINSILHNAGVKNSHNTIATPIFKQWQEQSEFAFGFMPYSEQVMPDVVNISSPVGLSAFDIHALLRATGKHNYMSARISVESQLNMADWKAELSNYWDQQLLQLLEFGFPLDSNRQCPRI